MLAADDSTILCHVKTKAERRRGRGEKTEYKEKAQWRAPPERKRREGKSIGDVW